MMAIRKQENEIYNKNGFVVLDKFIEYETITILGVPGVINRKIIICKNNI